MINATNLTKRFSTLEEDFNKVHNNRYDYSKLVYTGMKNKAVIICKEHKEFEQVLSKHLQGNNCPKCHPKFIKKPKIEKPKIKRVAWNKGLSKENNESVRKHSENLKSSYKSGELIHNRTGVKLTQETKDKMSKARIEFLKEHPEKIPTSFRDESFYLDKMTILYYIKVDNLFKIGVTLFRKNIEKSIRKRFLYDINNGVKIEIINTEVFDNGAEAFLKEQKIISENRDSKYTGEKKLKNGNSELFTNEILNY